MEIIPFKLKMCDCQWNQFLGRKKTVFRYLCSVVDNKMGMKFQYW